MTMTFLAMSLAAIPVLTAAGGVAGVAPGPWPVEKARTWYEKQPWPVGVNFLPSTAVNDVEMWQAESFDAATIDRELGWAREAGFNTVRVFINYVVWKADPEGLKERFDRFLATAARHGMTVLPVLFDDCAFAGKEPRIGKQDDPVPGVHNSAWVPSPGLKVVPDPAAWGDTDQYVKDLVRTFGRDARILAWDLYNEPGNSNLGEKSLPLVEATFAWAREAAPEQPLTMGPWADFGSRLSRRMMELSDIISFHAYDGPGGVRAKIDLCRSYGRPLLCTEWLHRPGGNTVASILPVFARERIGAYSWGLVAGRTQTYMPWGSKAYDATPVLWQHDLFHVDGKPFNEREMRTIKELTGKLPPRRIVAVVPTAQTEPVPWRYTFEKPSDDWAKPGFDDTGWLTGVAPFGTEEPPFDRHPRTTWTTAGIWLRREFDMPARAFDDLIFLIHFDEDVEIYIDGVLAAKVSGYNAAYEEVDIRPEARALLTPGRHRMAVRCSQTAGGQYIDMGIAGLAEQGRD